MNLAFGCSHTAGSEGNEPWTVLCERAHQVSFLNLGRLGGGLFHVLERARSFAAEGRAADVRFVVLQKPEFVRFPWFTTSAAFFSSGGVMRARNDFRVLPVFAQNSLAKDIFKQECAMLDGFVELFPNARFAYWQQWLEHLVATHWVNPVVTWLDQFEGYAKSKGFESFGTILDWEPLHERALVRGPFLSDAWMQLLIEEGWIISQTNGHTTTKHNALVAQRVAEWMASR